VRLKTHRFGFVSEAANNPFSGVTFWSNINLNLSPALLNQTTYSYENRVFPITRV
jgi:hypothetical protein